MRAWIVVFAAVLWLLHGPDQHGALVRMTAEGAILFALFAEVYLASKEG